METKNKKIFTQSPADETTKVETPLRTSPSGLSILLLSIVDLFSPTPRAHSAAINAISVINAILDSRPVLPTRHAETSKHKSLIAYGVASTDVLIPAVTIPIATGICMSI